MPDLDLTPSDYVELGIELNAIAKEFTNANSRSDAVADAVGHSRLHDAVRDFAHKWDDTREKMTGDISTLGEHSKAVGDAFTKTDSDLEKSVE